MTAVAYAIMNLRITNKNLALSLFQMKAAISKELEIKGLQVNQQTFNKTIQLYETKTSRHSVMIVGGTQAGKSVSWQTLQSAMTRLNKEGDPNFQIVKVK